MDLNALLRSLGPPISSADVRSAVTNANVNASFSEVTVPGGAIGVYISQLEAQLGAVLFLAAGAAIPTKASDPDGTLHLNFGVDAQTFYLPLDASDPPSMFVAELVAADGNFHFHFVIGTK